MSRDDVSLLGSILKGDKEVGEFTSQRIDDICYINMYQVSKKISYPRMVSKEVATTPLRTYEAHKHALQSIYGNQFIQMDTGLLVNIDMVKDFYRDSYDSLIANFGDGMTVRIANNKDKMDIVKDLMRGV